MSLSHVNMWENEVGIVPVTLEEAIKRYPHSVSGESGIFHCGVCSERVTLAFGPKLHYFRHTDQAKDSSCPERAYNLEYGEYRSSLNTTRILPLYLLRSSSTPAEIEFLIGFPPLPEQLLHKQPPAGMDVFAIGEDGKNKENIHWTITNDRFPPDEVTRLSVGTIPMQEYRFQFTGQEDMIRILRTNWGTNVSGISDQAYLLFDGNTGRLLMKGSDVKVNHKYLLLQKEQNSIIKHKKVVAIKQIPINRPDWFLFEIYAKELSKFAGEFFLGYGMNLVAEPACIKPVWPAFVRQKDILFYEGKETVFLQFGLGTSSAFPQQDITNWEACHIENKMPVYYLSFHSKEIQQFLCFGRHGRIFDTLYMRQMDFFPMPEKQMKLPAIRFLDESGTVFGKDVQHKLPKGKHIYLHSPIYEGHVDIRKDGFLCQRLSMKPFTTVEVKDITFGTEIHGYQGLDLVGSIRFEKEQKVSDVAIRDAYYSNLLESVRGKSVAIPHAWGQLTTELQRYPNTLHWFIEAIRRGHASAKAVALIRTIVREVRWNG